MLSRYRSSARRKCFWPGKLPPSPIQTVCAFEPSTLPISMHSMLWATACRRTARPDGRGCRTCTRASDPADPGRCSSSSRRSGARARPRTPRSAAGFSGLSHGMCSETAGVARTSWKIRAQSSSFSWMSRGSPGPGKRAKRVPPVPTPQEGTATVKRWPRARRALRFRCACAAEPARDVRSPPRAWTGASGSAQAMIARHRFRNALPWYPSVTTTRVCTTRNYLRNPSCSPPSTGMMCPVVFARRPLRAAEIASA